MAVSSIHIAIDRLRVPAGSTLDRVDLQRRVAVELAALLGRAPLTGTSGSHVELDAESVRAPSTASGAAVAHALARHIHTALLRDGGGRA